MSLDMRGGRSSIASIALVVLLTACSTGPTDSDVAPWKSGDHGVSITAAPDAGGRLSYRNCPTLDEAKAAIPVLVSGPDANAVPYKTMVLQCSYGIAERDIQGRPAGASILVFDATAEGLALWESVRTEPGQTGVVDLPGLGDRSFATGPPGQHELWVVRGDLGFHARHTRREGIPLDQMTALARSMLAGLDRPPR